MKLLSILLILCSLFLVACSSEPLIDSIEELEDKGPEIIEEVGAEEECIANDGVWYAGPMVDEQFAECYVKLEDAGEPCTDSSQCLGSCKALKEKEGSSEEGVCSELDVLYCFTVESGVVVYDDVCSVI